jgi:putative transposase
MSGAMAIEIEAMVLLPDHLHTLWKLPENDTAYSKRWGWIKKTFTQLWLDAGNAALPVSESKLQRRRFGVWQVRFWEHEIRNDSDMEAHLNYIHYNPVRHGLVSCPRMAIFNISKMGEEATVCSRLVLRL